MRPCRAISSFFFNESLSDLAIVIFFWLSFQRCRQIITNSSLWQKLKKNKQKKKRWKDLFARTMYLKKLNRNWNNHEEVERLSNIFIRNNDGNDHFKEHHFLQKVYEGLY